jgi:hypothetical protein
VKRLLRKLYSTPRLAALSTGVIALLVFASAGLAAWFIWGGLYGNGASKF